MPKVNFKNPAIVAKTLPVKKINTLPLKSQPALPKPMKAPDLTHAGNVDYVKNAKDFAKRTGTKIKNAIKALIK